MPDEPSQKLLDRVIGLVTDKKFKDRRRQFYDYQIHLLEGGQKPELILKDLDRLVADYNAQALAKGEKCRWETVITVFAVAGAFLAAWPVFLPAGSSLAATAAIAGAVSSVGPAVWSKLQAREDVDASQKIAAGGAMFHQIEAESGFQFLTSRRSLGR